MKIINREIWRKIARISERTNIPVYVVGGTIRDLLMGIGDSDNDFLVMGPVKPFAEKVSWEISGSRVVHFSKFGTAFLVYEGRKLEFAEPRIPGKNLSQDEWLAADLFHRDFTINAIAAHLTGEGELDLFDPTGGMEDLHQRKLKTPIEPVKTFREDPIRILRALRFAVQFSFSMSAETQAAMRQCAADLERISPERIRDELWKILQLKHPSKALKPMFKLGILQKFLPEAANLTGVERRGNFNHKDIFIHSLKVLDKVADMGGDTVTRFVALLHDVAKPITKRFDPVQGFTFHGHEDLGANMVEKIARRLRLPNKTVRLAVKLTLLHMRPVNLVGEQVTDSAIRRLMFQAGEDLERLLTLCRADITTGNPKKVKAYLENFDRITERMREVEEMDKIRTFQSPVRGDEIMEICDILPGPLVGKLKKAIENAILEGIIPNDYQAAKEYFLKHKDEWIENYQSSRELKK